MSHILSLEGSLPLPLLAVYLGAGLACFCSFCLSLKRRKKDAYLSAYFFFGSCACVCAFFSAEGGGEAAALTGLFACALFGLTYPVLGAAIAYEQKKEVKRLALLQERKVEKFVLPDKDNAYLRDRLQTALCPQSEEQVPVEQAFQLTCVRRLIAKLKEQDLSPADRVEVDRLSAASICLRRLVRESTRGGNGRAVPCPRGGVFVHS